MSTRADVIDAAETFDPSSVQGLVGEAERERTQTLELYPIEAWDSLGLDQYAQGQSDHPDNLCRWMERQTPHMGSIRGGSAHKLIIYRKGDGTWHFPTLYETVEQAWIEVRAAFSEAFALAGEGRWQEIDGLAALQSGPGLLIKLLYAYFPDEILPITSGDKLSHFLELLDRSDLAGDQKVGRVERNRALFAELRSLGPGANWTTKEWERFLFRKFSPFEGRVVKIAPGRDAKYWNDCLANGYICVGWDEVGDLAGFQSKQEFLEAFATTFDYTTQSKETEKANELWTLLDLDEGERIVANKGTSEVLAIGKVVSPGYQWREDREEMKHTVAVEWDVSAAKTISARTHWGLKTVKELQGAEREAVLGGDSVVPGGPSPPPTATLERLIEELDRKGQVVLYGPPGTGKTRVANQLAGWWREHRAGDASNASSEAIETSDTRAWVVVASPKKLEWDWEDLEREGTTDFHLGRVKSNYGAIQVGDLVFGYTATPAKRVKAIAKVSALGEESGARTFSVSPIAVVGEGLDWAAMRDDDVLSDSQPVTNGAQGTLFALTTSERARMVEMVAEVDADAEAAIEEHFGAISSTDEEVGLVEWITFHPAYSYEDFVEGFRPKPKGSGMELTLEDGVFKRISLQALASPGTDYLLIIDEINRANVASVFGELITLIEADKRESIEVRLPYSRALFRVPKNLYIVGTMNTADRSIRLLDTALRRRFGFVELMPDPTVLEGPSVEGLQLDVFLSKLNGQIASAHGRDKQVGHSYLLKDGQPISEASEFARAFWRELLPLLQEYSYEDYGILADLVGEDIIDREARAVKPDVEGNPGKLIAALVDRFQGAESEAE